MAIEKTREERREEIVALVKKAYGDDLGTFSEMNSKSAEYVSDTMHNLAIICGAIATGALVLLGSDVASLGSIVAGGAAILLLETFLIFGYLFHNHGKVSFFLSEHKEKKLVPVAALLVKYADMQNGKITSEEFDTGLLKVAKDFQADVNKKNFELAYKKSTTNYWDSFFAILFGLGIVLIVLGLFLPYIYKL